MGLQEIEAQAEGDDTKHEYPAENPSNRLRRDDTNAASDQAKNANAKSCIGALMITQADLKIEAYTEGDDTKHEYRGRNRLCFSSGHRHPNNGSQEAKETCEKEYMHTFMMGQSNIGIRPDSECDDFEHENNPEP